MKRSMHTVASVLAMAMIAGAARCHAIEAASRSTPDSYLHLKQATRPEGAPHVWERTEGKKHIVVIGTYHILDPQAPMYRRMAAIFERVRPQFILHESTAPDDLATETREQAIRRGADLGFTVQLARQLGVPTESADAPARAEMAGLLAHHPASDVFAYVVSTRLIGSYRHPDLHQNAAEYPAFFKNQILDNGIPVQPGWETWEGFMHEYRQVTGRSPAAKTWDPRLLDPVLKLGRLNEVARTSDALRDRYLFAAMRESLKEYDRVIVVFGDDHVLALEPSLDGLFKSAQ